MQCNFDYNEIENMCKMFKVISFVYTSFPPDIINPIQIQAAQSECRPEKAISSWNLKTTFI